MLNSIVTLKPINGRQDPGAVPGGSTINTFTECAYDGAEPGSTDAIENVELPVGDDRKSSKQNKRKQ